METLNGLTSGVDISVVELKGSVDNSQDIDFRTSLEPIVSKSSKRINKNLVKTLLGIEQDIEV